MQNTVLCTLTEEENSEILALNLRRDTLNELFLTIANSSLDGDRTNILCEKLYKDMDMAKRGILHLLLRSSHPLWPRSLKNR